MEQKIQQRPFASCMLRLIPLIASSTILSSLFLFSFIWFSLCNRYDNVVRSKSIGKLCSIPASAEAIVAIINWDYSCLEISIIPYIFFTNKSLLFFFVFFFLLLFFAKNWGEKWPRYPALFRYKILLATDLDVEVVKAACFVRRELGPHLPVKQDRAKPAVVVRHLLCLNNSVKLIN